MARSGLRFLFIRCVWCAAAARLQSKGGGLNDFASGFEGLEANSGEAITVANFVDLPGILLDDPSLLDDYMEKNIQQDDTHETRSEDRRSGDYLDTRRAGPGHGDKARAASFGRHEGAVHGLMDVAFSERSGNQSNNNTGEAASGKVHFSRIGALVEAAFPSAWANKNANTARLHYYLRKAANNVTFTLKFAAIGGSETQGETFQVYVCDVLNMSCRGQLLCASR
jgi:hypothetical protein